MIQESIILQINCLNEDKISIKFLAEELQNLIYNLLLLHYKFK